MLVSSNITGCGLTVKGIQTEWHGDNHREEWFSIVGSRWFGLVSISGFVNTRYLKPWKIECQTFRRIVNDSPRKRQR